MKNVSTIAAALLFLIPSAVQAAGPHTTALITSSIVALQKSDWAAGARFASIAMRDHSLVGEDALIAATSLCVQAANVGAFDQAEMACERSVQLAPGRWSGYLNRANFRMLSGDRVGAAEDYVTAKSLNPATDVIDRSIDNIARGLGPQYVVLLPASLPENSQTAAAN